LLLFSGVNTATRKPPRIPEWESLPPTKPDPPGPLIPLDQFFGSLKELHKDQAGKTVL
jgi:hypothetical protein